LFTLNALFTLQALFTLRSLVPLGASGALGTNRTLRSRRTDWTGRAWWAFWPRGEFDGIDGCRICGCRRCIGRSFGIQGFEISVDFGRPCGSSLNEFNEISGKGVDREDAQDSSDDATHCCSPCDD
jgi:hypothetical protein